MHAPTYGPGDDRAHAALARELVAFDEKFLTGSGISDFQRGVAAKLVSIVESLPPESVTARAAVGVKPKGTVFVNLVPRQEDCAEMTIEIERHAYVHLGVGEGTTYSLPYDVWDPRAKDVVKFSEQIVKAVVAGRFRETIYYRGKAPVRWTSELCVEETDVPQDRTDLLATLRGVFQKRRKREVTYAPYG